jgi:hypothetical protein
MPSNPLLSSKISSMYVLHASRGNAGNSTHIPSVILKSGGGECQSPVSLQDPRKWKTSVREVAESDGLRVNNYRELLEKVSDISYHNPQFTILFRGQDYDYMTKSSSGTRRSAIYPIIYRPDKGYKNINKAELEKRFISLDDYCNKLVDKYEYDGKNRLKIFKEIQWALLQHYKKERTPLIDVTHSLDVAVYFANERNRENVGYLYMFGFPHLTGSISYHVDERLVIVKLPSACPPDAIRAHFQQAYLVGSYPHDRNKSSRHNLSNRMIAKFRLDFSKFWRDGFTKLPEKVLVPNNDQIKKLIDGI